MNRIDQYVTRNPEKMHFIPFITAGDPNSETTIKLALALQELGASALELGIPYSDPLADGPVIQKASERALRAGMSLEKALQLVPKMREEGLKIPVIIFTYYNLLLQLEQQKCFEKIDRFDIDGLLVPDLPFEESTEIKEACKSANIKLISLVAPTTSPARLKSIGQEAEGFLYCVSSLGVTGERASFHPSVRSFLESVRLSADCPIAVGFGISSAKQLKEFEGLCDGFIVGSAIVREVESRSEGLMNESTRDEAIADIKTTLSQKLLLHS